jgi:acyl carrier protein
VAGRVAVPDTKRRSRQTMQQDDIEAALAAILKEVGKVNRVDVKGDKRLREDLGIDSLSLIDVAVAAEDRFGIRIPDEDLECLQAVGDMLDYIRQPRSALEAASGTGGRVCF